MHCVLCIYFEEWYIQYCNLKGQSNEIYNLWFFSSLEPVWATDQQVKIFLILVKNSLSYTTFKFKNLTPQGIIPRGVNKNPPKHDSPVYDTPASQSPRGIITRRVTFLNFFDTKVRISQRNLN